MVIDVGNMNGIVVSGSTATIGAGAKLVDIYSQLGAQGLSIPSGSCPTIGIAGITQGGGIGVVDRAYGLTCDNLLSAQVVIADGTVLTCDANNNSDLFWALRGGGGGNFGVVTSFTFQTFATSPLTSFGAQFAFADAAGVLNAWQNWPQTAPNTLWAGLVIDAGGGPGGTPSISVSGTFIGTPQDFAPYASQFLAATGATPQNSGSVAQAFTDVMLGGCQGATVSQCHLAGETSDGLYPRSPFAASSDFFNTALPQAGINAMLQAMAARQQSGKSGAIIMDLMGGAIAQVAPDATAFVHRNALFSAQYYANFSLGTDPAVVSEAQAWANGMRSTMQAWSSGEAYQNYVDPLLANPLQAYYGSNLARLQQVKQKYDPNKVFSFAQGL
jgi:FAD/FMN-containing dehydrogenase